MVGRQVESIVTKAEDPHGPVVLELKNVRLHKRAQETVSIQYMQERSSVLPV